MKINKILVVTIIGLIVVAGAIVFVCTKVISQNAGTSLNPGHPTDADIQRANNPPIVTQEQAARESGPSPFDDIDAKLHVRKGVELDPEKIQIVKELKDITLCGETYKAKQIFIDGVDVVQRIAQLLKENSILSQSYCSMLKDRAENSGDTISSGEEIHITLDREADHYSVSLSVGAGLIDIRSGIPHSWDAGFPATVVPEKNNIIGVEGFKFGTLKP